MRIQCPENLRVPQQGSSEGGESGPKARLKSVVDGKRVNIPVLNLVGIEGRRRLSWNYVWILVEAFKVLIGRTKTILELRRYLIFETSVLEMPMMSNFQENLVNFSY